MKHPGQGVTTISQVNWCGNAEMYIQDQYDNPFSLEDFVKLNVTQLEALIDLVRGNLDSVRRKIIVALVTTDVHARDIAETLLKENVNSLNDFTWQQQLRYYWDEEGDGNCFVR